MSINLPSSTDLNEKFMDWKSGGNRVPITHAGEEAINREKAREVYCPQDY